MTMLRAGAKIWNEIFHMCVLSTFLFMESSSFTVLTSPRLCPPNEVYKSCGGCEPTCLTSKIPVACTDVCRQGCQCIPGFLRNSDGKCVENCNGDCPPNQQYVTCGGCEPTCDVPKPVTLTRNSDSLELKRNSYRKHVWLFVLSAASVCLDSYVTQMETACLPVQEVIHLIYV
ncbi:trypsin Inhibitor like cysteine rich domain protein [Necator americanus]|uniref:Trypsin Inhibitor like cysteine rich domain protein n=1 Tax=Necator americanus TaxID=51031 RepID=W2SXH3_NECAM|nr:trypsin Inhibitor like cysteine rich domain protein [Necator americanus]ETN73327.1 trypsin Inhibitor like cysteine rich domain protein [Necator americanus]